MEHPIGALPRTPFPASRDFPSRGNERYEGKNSESYTSRTISAFSLFGGWRHHLARWEACHMTQKVNPVTLALYSSPDRAIPQPSARRAVKLKNPWARKGPSILRTFFRNPSTQPAADRRPQPSGRSPVNPHTEGVSTGRQPYKKRAALRLFFRYNREKRREGMNHDI